jgi:hypothetical protein
MARGILLGTAALFSLVCAWKGVPAAAGFIRMDSCLDRGGRYDRIAGRCEVAQGRAPPGPPAAAAVDRHPPDTIRIIGPTVIAYFAVTQAEVDADAEAMEALADFQHYLPSMERRLAACGVNVAETYRTVFLRHGEAVERFAPSAREVRVGYWMMRPGFPDRTLDGVHTDADLLAEAAEYFGLPDACSRSAQPSG